MTETPDQPDLYVNLAIQLGPWLRADGTPYTGDLQKFTDQLASYFRENLDRFTAVRDTDLFLAVASTRGDEKAGRQYRTGHYVIDEGQAEPPTKNTSIPTEPRPSDPAEPSPQKNAPSATRQNGDT